MLRISGAWILGNFDTVSDARAALSKVRVCASVVPSFGGVPTAHLALHDAAGNSLVVELIDGEQKIYDNPFGVMTNSPTFDRHLTNLKNYLFVSSKNSESIKVAGTVLRCPVKAAGSPAYQATGRRHRVSCAPRRMLSFAKKTTSAQSGINLAAHILNAVDIPRGTISKSSAVSITPITLSGR